MIKTNGINSLYQNNQEENLANLSKDNLEKL